MAKFQNEDMVLRAIAKESLNFLLQHTEMNRINCILLTGSLANGEGTVIEDNSSLITSDFDFVIFLDISSYLKNKRHFKIMSQEISKRFMDRGVKTHILFHPVNRLLGRIFRSKNCHIYEYEFTRSSRCILGKLPSFTKRARPSKSDAMELMFKVISDQIFIEFNELSKIEKTYIYAKKALTLLNSILIFYGHPGETYQIRLESVKECACKGVIPINQDEIKTLDIFTQFKLSGSLKHLLDSFKYKNINSLIKFQKEFLKKFTKQILYYELANLHQWSRETYMVYDIFPANMTGNFQLLKQYSLHSNTRFISRIMGILFFLFWSIVKNIRRKELFTTFIFHKQPPKTILNVLITLIFLHKHTLAKKMSKETFTWIDFNEYNIIQGLYSLWQTAEQSIKLD